MATAEEDAAMLDAAIRNNKANVMSFKGTVGTPPVTTPGTLNSSTSNIDPKIGSSSTISRLEYPADQPKYFLAMNISTFSRRDFISIGQLTPKKVIALPMPMQITDSNQVVFSEQSISLLVGVTAALASSKTVRDVGNDLLQKSGVTLSQGSQQPNQPANDPGGNLAKGVLGATAIAGTGEGGRAASALTGYAPNQFLTVLLQGPAYKRFSLSWKFSPKTPQESETLRQIIKYINNSKSPTLTGGGALFGFPDIFELGFYPNADYLYKFKPAVLEALTINYAGSGTPTFYRGRGAPESVEVIMNFFELEFWLNGQYNDSNDPFDRSQLNAGGGGDTFGNNVILNQSVIEEFAKSPKAQVQSIVPG